MKKLIRLNHRLIEIHHWAFIFFTFVGGGSFFLRGKVEIAIWMLFIPIVYFFILIFVRGNWTDQIDLDIESKTITLHKIIPYFESEVLNVNDYKFINIVKTWGRFSAYRIELLSDEKSQLLCIISPVSISSGFYDFPREEEPKLVVEIQQLIIDAFKLKKLQ